ncbi:response regulator with CheY-like receiver, AAA-type ATPase, and DNA-binding domains [Desulfosporosinus orientis DSM 765]|uniref:Stage 0 sporulation protein A homolog n=1 Tax=Desulfosporosinus orientis (strain ATCC 19365 / DSM 765 / NCIMB 8382 / VKM B-1628 / Singapore I) TaxID=768706 RepID=G7W595_DESOD|nr:sigma-54 dependent transcriptional regulator [Desulfosporosinus orientis]AET66323.1 response regulator with CheY-like receiver, AAA-type ATPase, and DNA-binding domains [Desulfosporosinus orientis DSM 765]
MIPRVLVIDDEERMCWALERALSHEGYQVVTATRGLQGIEMALETEPSTVILDLKMPDIDGIEVLKRLKSINPNIPVIMITAHGTIETAIEAMKIGATDYITKPFKLDELKVQVKQALHLSNLENEVNYLRQELGKKYGKMVGQSEAIKEVSHLIQQVAKTNATVLITGESGTGKEVAAVEIHKASNRANMPFVAVNCAALPEHLLESELFGHEKGAFTGATNRKKGRFEMADKGTILLDEIGDMPISMQVKLLRILQERCFERVGGTETISIDVRVIATTNSELSTAIANGTFREDLYYRLNVMQIKMPPLRLRKEDIPLLVNHFLSKFDPSHTKKISPEAMKILTRYDWPGNIRELQNAIERPLIVCQSNEILPIHLPSELLENIEDTAEPIINLPEGGFSLEELEKQLIVKALEKNNYNQTKTAKYLGISRPTLLYRMNKHNLKY